MLFIDVINYGPDLISVLRSFLLLPTQIKEKQKPL